MSLCRFPPLNPSTARSTSSISSLDHALSSLVAMPWGFVELLRTNLSNLSFTSPKRTKRWSSFSLSPPMTPFPARPFPPHLLKPPPDPFLRLSLSLSGGLSTDSMAPQRTRCPDLSITLPELSGLECEALFSFRILQIRLTLVELCPSLSPHGSLHRYLFISLIFAVH
ncbi:unnamed protein product [Microthlaspi erraticum]|uniref:Uncharacterized protein n=1 Tax=Microthlaspi erraticum TaxID=1685480 RepID=A0A6D2KHK7_9BRAS|nr:unnamed protein product [Microthlaspi erraticum]CAA7054225.1 unnamed protein product [Microthlaspi erraticum]